MKIKTFKFLLTVIFVRFEKYIFIYRKFYTLIFQIAELTSQIASLEIQIKQGGSQQDRVADDLKQMKDLCMKLDKEKDELKRELRSREDQNGTVSFIIY